MRWNVRLFVDDAWSDLRDVHVNQQTVVPVDFKEFVLSQVLDVNVVLHVHMFMRQNHVGVSVSITWSVKVMHFQVLPYFVFVKLKVKAAIRCNFLVDIRLKGLLFFQAKLL